MQGQNKKKKLNYRVGHDDCLCRICDFFIPDLRIHGSNNPARYEARCKLIGLESSDDYAVAAIGVCDEFDNTETAYRQQNAWC